MDNLGGELEGLRGPRGILEKIIYYYFKILSCSHSTSNCALLGNISEMHWEMISNDWLKTPQDRGETEGGGAGEGSLGGDRELVYWSPDLLRGCSCNRPGPRNIHQEWGHRSRLVETEIYSERPGTSRGREQCYLHPKEWEDSLLPSLKIECRATGRDKNINTNFYGECMYARC